MNRFVFVRYIARLRSSFLWHKSLPRLLFIMLIIFLTLLPWRHLFRRTFLRTLLFRSNFWFFPRWCHVVVVWCFYRRCRCGGRAMWRGDFREGWFFGGGRFKVFASLAVAWFTGFLGSGLFGGSWSCGFGWGTRWAGHGGEVGARSRLESSMSIEIGPVQITHYGHWSHRSRPVPQNSSKESVNKTVRYIDIFFSVWDKLIYCYM